MLTHTNIYSIHTQKLEVHNSGPAVSQVKLVPFMNAVALRLSCTLCVKKGQKSQRPEITEKLVRSSVQSCPPSLKIKFQVKPLLLPSCLLFSQMIVCSHPQKHPPSFTQGVLWACGISPYPFSFPSPLWPSGDPRSVRGRNSSIPYFCHGDDLQTASCLVSAV